MLSNGPVLNFPAIDIQKTQPNPPHLEPFLTGTSGAPYASQA